MGHWPKLPDIKELVLNGAQVHFVRYEGGQLWYRCDQGFEFPVPVEDVGTGVCDATDRAPYYMRWIRRHLALISEALRQQEETK